MQLCDTINLCLSSNYTYNTLVKFLAVGTYLFLSPNNCGQEEGVKNLENRTITAAAVDQPSFYHSVKFKPSQTSLVEFEGGINVEAYRFLRDSLNFREKALKSRGQMNPDEKGELQNEGIAEVLNSNKADIAISLFEPLLYRVAGPYGVRFLHPVFKSSKAIAVFTQPPKTSRNVFGDPFQRKVWMAVFLVDIFAILTLWLFLYINKEESGRRLSFVEIFRRVHIWTICIFTRQATILYTSSQTSYLKVALLVSFFTTFLFHSLYSSALTSMLAADYKPISSFDQIMQGPYLLYYDKYVPFIRSVLDSYKQPTRNIVEMGPEAQKIMNKALPEIFNSKAVLLTSEERYYSFFRKRKHDSVFCNKLSNVPLTTVTIKSANFVKQGSPYRDIFNIKFLVMLQSGLIQKLYREHEFKSTLTCLQSYFVKFATLDIYDTAFPFLILIYLSTISVMILLAEKVVADRGICRTLHIARTYKIRGLVTNYEK